MDTTPEPEPSVCVVMRTVQGGTFRQLFEVLKDCVREVNIEFGEGGFRIRAMDAGHIMVADVRVHAEGLEYYRCSRPMTLGVCTKNMHDLLKNMTTRSMLELLFDLDHPDRMRITITDQERRLTSVAHMKLYEIDMEDLVIEGHGEGDCHVQLPSADFTKIVREMHAVGDTLEMRCPKGDPVLYLRVCGEMGDLENTLFPNEDQTVITPPPGGDVTGDFALRYLTTLARAGALCQTMRIHFRTDFPLTLEYRTGNVLTLWMMLAPRARDDDVADL